MKTKKEIVDNWLPRYTGTALEDFGEYIILVNFMNYVKMFADWYGAEIKGVDRSMPSATANGVTIINFGIGSATAISKLVVKWPSGTVDELLNPSINSLITFEEGSSPILPPTLLGDCDLNGVVNFFDITPFIDILSDETFLLEADCNEDGTVDFFDITPFIDILSEQE